MLTVNTRKKSPSVCSYRSHSADGWSFSEAETLDAAVAGSKRCENGSTVDHSAKLNCTNIDPMD